jgi:hypothetical protein
VDKQPSIASRLAAFMSTDASTADASTTTGAVAAWIAPWVERLEQAPRYRWARLFLRRNEQYVPPALFLGGVGWDAATLRRIDALVDNVLLGTYLALLGGFIVLAVLDRRDAPLPQALERLTPWATPGIQFFAGGLFSAYVIYYTQSASLTTASLFLGVLVAALVANEIIWSRTFNVYVLLGVYFLAVFCFVTFFLPVVLGRMGEDVFLASGAISVGAVGALILFLQRQSVFESGWACGGAFGVVVGLWGLFLLFYQMHWIPPVPLALRHGGAYEHVAVEGDAYALRHERAPWYAVWDDTGMETVPHAPGDSVFCFAAVFAPTALETKIYHRWQRYDSTRAVWQDTDRIGYRVVGGRRNGYRGYTFKRYVRPGAWRVTIETPDARPIGRVEFQVVPPDSSRAREWTTRLYR